VKKSAIMRAFSGFLSFNAPSANMKRRSSLSMVAVCIVRIPIIMSVSCRMSLKFIVFDFYFVLMIEQAIHRPERGRSVVSSPSAIFNWLLPSSPRAQAMSISDKQGDVDIVTEKMAFAEPAEYSEMNGKLPSASAHPLSNDPSTFIAGFMDFDPKTAASKQHTFDSYSGAGAMRRNQGSWLKL
jgi:hypothetical protein